MVLKVFSFDEDNSGFSWWWSKVSDFGFGHSIVKAFFAVDMCGPEFGAPAVDLAIRRVSQLGQRCFRPTDSHEHDPDTDLK